ncbi:MAG: hypothetical protein ACJ731_01970 [Vicinamibacterales bacterium]
MQCRNCGTEIADKAIVCYRCGVGTTEPVRRPAPLPTRGRGPSLLAGIIPLLLALVMLAGADASGYPREADMAAAVLGAAGVLMLIARVMRRR